MSFSNIIDQFHNKHSFPDPSTTEEPNLSTPLVRGQKINNLYKNIKDVMKTENTHFILAQQNTQKRQCPCQGV